MLERIERQRVLGSRQALIVESAAQHETEENSEVLLVPAFDVMTLSGPAGTGKTIVADLIAARALGLDSVKVGQDFRIRLQEETGEEQGAYFTVKEEDDFLVDGWQVERMRNARKPHPGPESDSEMRWRPILVEGRLSGAIGARTSEESQGLNNPRIYRILLTYDPGGDQTGRYERILPRERIKNPDKTDDQIIEDTERRDKELVEKFHILEQSENPIYQDLLRGGHPYDPNLMTANDHPVYNLVVDTKGKTPTEVYKEIMLSLSKRELLRPLRRSDFGDGELGNIAFQMVANLTPCEALVQNDEKCERYAVRTVDSYHFNPGEKGPASIQVHASCSRKHSYLIMRDVEKLADVYGMQLKFGKNGKQIGQSNSQRPNSMGLNI